MSKKVKAVIAVMVAVIVVLAGSLVYVSTDSQKKIAVANAKYQDVVDNYKLYKNIISQDEVEQTLFGQPISTERDGEYRIVRGRYTNSARHLGSRRGLRH
jgi:hypothetical protein